ncbi:aminopeptidase P family protein [Candidatus Woesearchaeota archaeon]|nr:aminopeptidase P family protein [Candidatus Woesearchaeota archaeon]
MKLKLFQQYLRKQKIDLAFLVHPDINITYFTQLKPSFAMLLITSNKASFYLTKLDSFPQLKNISSQILGKGWEKKIGNKKIKRIGVNKESLTLVYQDKLKKLFPQAKLVDVSEILKGLRSLKVPEEITKISRACKITSDAFNDLIKELKTKKLKTEQDVSLFLESEFRRRGGEVAFPTIAAMGKNAAIPHHITSNQKLHKGFLLIDCGASYQHYNADMTRMIYLGTPSVSEKAFYALLLKSQESVISIIKEGIPFKNLDDISRKNLGKYSSKFVHSLGHGIGLEVHEAPSFSPDPKNIIKKNQIFTIEPGIYFPNKFGLRIEDTLYFDGKVKILTKASKKLVSLNIFK